MKRDDRLAATLRHRIGVVWLGLAQELPLLAVTGQIDRVALVAHWTMTLQGSMVPILSSV